ncbi:hypothetical protein [Salmonirosea aquatica]|uniref:Transporter n=1 Tax=Salmonirosea aquatica TaxID=2654236 RepID=A0A7C9BDV0_9BACT|nr:hypothetical protein [Cytophagaceae bacterium SJW1-29]
MKTQLFLFLLLFGTISYSAQAQDADSTAFKPVNATIFLKDGTQLRGLLLSESPVGVRIRTDNLGEMTVTTDKIERVEKNMDGFYRNGQYWFPNPHSTRYFFAPSALPLSRREGYYQNAYVFVNSVSVGVTDHFTMGGGFVLNPTFRDWQVVFLTPKISFPSQSNVTFSLGVIAIGVFNRRYEYDPQTGVSRKNGFGTDLAGIGYGTLTFGDAERNGSVGLGWGFSDSDIGSSPVINLSYMTRVGRKLGFVTENWIVIPSQNSDTGAVLSGGLRFFGEKMSVDLALLVPTASGVGFIAIPYVDFVVLFGQKKKKK